MANNSAKQNEKNHQKYSTLINLVKIGLIGFYALSTIFSYYRGTISKY